MLKVLLYQQQLYQQWNKIVQGPPREMSCMNIRNDVGLNTDPWGATVTT